MRWTGTLRPQRSGTYRLGTIATMQFDLYLDDSLLVRSDYNYMDELGDPRVVAAEPIHLEAGRDYRLRLDAGEGHGDAQMQLVWTAPQPDLAAEAVAAAEAADAVVLFLGLTPRLEGEEMRVDVEGFRGGDRTRLELPASQQRLLERAALQPGEHVLDIACGTGLNDTSDHLA